MLRVTTADVARCGGFLNALTDASTEVLHKLLESHVRWSPDQIPERLIVHKAPHLDEYLAEMLFRAVLKPADRQREFLEVSLHAEDDSSAQVYWPTAAVFGIGGGKPSGRYAQYLFDEHLQGGGRREDSCTEVVLTRCFDGVPPTVSRIAAEVTGIDARAGAHELHLNNLLKTCHSVQYQLGPDASGHAMSGRLSDAWKRAIVNALLAAVFVCLENGIDITETDRIKRLMRELFDRFAANSPYRDREHYAESLLRLRNSVSNVSELLRTARISVSGQDVPQLLLAPFLAVAAAEVWGTEIAYMLMTHFWESEILKNIHFRRISDLLETCFKDPHHPRSIYTPDCSVSGVVVPERKFTGQKMVRGAPQPAGYSSPVWIVACRYTNFVLQPNKAIARFIGDRNCGIGVSFCENTKDTNKVLFKGKSLPDQFWAALVERIQDAEPGLWVRPQPTAPFILNGNAAHRYVDLSELTPARLARLCREVA